MLARPSEGSWGLRSGLHEWADFANSTGDIIDEDDFNNLNYMMDMYDYDGSGGLDMYEFAELWDEINDDDDDGDGGDEGDDEPFHVTMTFTGPRIIRTRMTSRETLGSARILSSWRQASSSEDSASREGDHVCLRASSSCKFVGIIRCFVLYLRHLHAGLMSTC